MTILHLQAELHEKMWGGSALKAFNYKIPSDHTGEAWTIAAHGNGQSTVINGKLAGQGLSRVWQNHPELFGGHGRDEAFPLLVKILDAHENLSIQVHPNDEQSHEKFGKTESWYILDAKPESKIYYGHHAKTRDELKKMVDQKEWDKLLRTIPVQKGDFFYVASGTFHALGAGIVALEIQQSSDTTYRFYDFDRIDATTKEKRPLQIEEALAVTTVPHVDPTLIQDTTIVDQTVIERLVVATKFTIDKLLVRGPSLFELTHHYELFTVIEGSGFIHADQIKKGDSFIVLSDSKNYRLDGDMTLIRSFVTPTTTNKDVFVR
ncbi:mannose-6-phosphate isomerase [Leuconostoc mesenteroides P45]|uniref:type I phosphomannose isomerase catalytic subunit n=1 Tax=Leuconostoc mesenteroides TaxID=1245 RepID=UPI000504BE7C|nr:type I phosphomannose isomerase catalytic subunit [Leuconostoc mesenteroides]KGB49943.1 mannose-6-phosphate isomerase [Leuconostoc mesenteroides P45]